MDSLWTALATASEDMPLTNSSSVRARLEVDAAGHGFKWISWGRGARLQRAGANRGPFPPGVGFTCAGLGALLQRWTSRPVSIEDD
jgi:hypothetical protein